METEELELRPARISDRFIAYLLDLAPFLAGLGVSLYVVVAKGAADPTLELLYRFSAAWIGLLVLYQTAGNILGGTVGKRLMGLAVVRKDGRPLGPLRALVRGLGYLLSTPFFNFGFLIALFHPESRALHDLLSGSLVIESRAKKPAESCALFLGAAFSITALFGGGLYYHLSRPYPSDLLAVAKAEQGLKILALCQEKHKAGTGQYTRSLGDLALASGDPEQFQAAMLALFQPDRFQLEASLTGYRSSAAARDRKKTRVSISGPSR